MTQAENNAREHKVYGFSESPEKVVDLFIKSLQDGMSWASDTTEHWAELKTFHLPKELVLFNLGVLGFVGAMRADYHFVALFIVFILSVISVLLSFWFMWKVTNENISSVTRRRMIMQGTLEGFLTKRDPIEIMNNYNIEMAGVAGKTKEKEKEKCWNLIQKISIMSFIASMIIAVLGLLVFK